MSIGQGAIKVLKAQQVEELGALDGAGPPFSEESRGSEGADTGVLACHEARHQDQTWN